MASVHAGQMRALTGHVPPASALVQPLDALPGSNILHLAIGLPLHHQDALRELLNQLYDPASPKFHRFLTSEQFTAAFGPTEKEYQSVIDFARASGFSIVNTFSNRSLLEVKGRVADVEAAFHVHFRRFQHPTEPRTFYAPDVEPTVDTNVPVLFIAGLTDYQLPHLSSLHATVPALHATSLTKGRLTAPNAGSITAGDIQCYGGQDLRSAYVPGVTNTGAGQSIGLVEFDSYYPADISNYVSLAAETGLNSSVTLSNVFFSPLTPSSTPGSGNSEVALDIDMSICMAPGLSKIYVYMATNDPASPDVVLGRMASDDLSQQLSCSWSGFYDTNIENDFVRYATQGQSFFIASGDSGAYYLPYKSGRHTYSNPVSEPCDNPNVTSVGGTTLYTTGPVGSWTSETTWNWFSQPLTNGLNANATSGGVSTNWNLPVWQQGISTTTNGASAAYRNFPDVAMLANAIAWFADNGDGVFGGGTSAAAPLWAGMTALINQQRTAQGQPMVGSFNPTLYALAKSTNYQLCFHDITVGNNTNLHSEGLYSSEPGYDLCTGWGSPNGPNLLSYLCPEPLKISPSAGFTASGPQGGPFVPTGQTLVLTNVATTAFNWALGVALPWLSASSNGGSLVSGGAAAMITISLDSAAGSLAAGTYTNTVWLTNLDDQVVQSRQYVLTVAGTAPVVTWTNPAAITYGTPLGPAQLDATANVPGTFSYFPPGGSVLPAGTELLGVIFTPTNAVENNSVTDEVTLVVSPAPLTVTAANASRVFGQPNPLFQGAIIGLQNGDEITANYTCSAGSNSMAGNYPIVPSLVDPADLETNYTVSLVDGSLTIQPAAVTLNWTNPAAITYGTALSSAQLNASANTTGSFAYHPAGGTVLYPGTRMLTAIFTPSDGVDYLSATASVSLVVAPAVLTLTATPASMSYGGTLPGLSGTVTGFVGSDDQANATTGTLSFTTPATSASPVGKYAIDGSGLTASNYTLVQATGNATALTINPATPAFGGLTNSASITYGMTNVTLGGILGAGTVYPPDGETVEVTINGATQAATLAGGVFRIEYDDPSLATDEVAGSPYVITYAYEGDSNFNAAPEDTNTSLTVSPATPQVTWTNPAAITYGTALSGTQLDASANVAGSFSYTPPAGTVPGVGSDTLSADFMPADSTNYVSVNNTTVNLTVNPAPPPMASSIVITNGNGIITFTGIAGVTYVTESAVSLAGPWTAISTNTPTAGGIWQVIDPNANGSQKFYQAVIP